MLSRRMVLAAVAAFPAGAANGQSAASPFVGEWRGEVEGVGATLLVITAVRAGGQVEGRMEFELNRFVSTFGDTYDTTRNLNRGVASGNALTIEAALGGIYELVLGANHLAGTYVRGTTYLVPVTFSRI